MRTSRISTAILLTLISTSCLNTSHSRFDSQQWINGGKGTRGSMVQDLINQKTLIDKSGMKLKHCWAMPDDEEGDWYGYDVVTISRCRFWKCFLNVNFNAAQRVESVAVSD